MAAPKMIKVQLGSEVTNNTPWLMLGYVQYLHSEIHELQSRLEQLEARLKQDSSNSNKPPSSDPPFKAKNTASKTKKTQRKKRKGSRQQCMRPTQIEEIHPTCSCGCGEILEPEPYYIHQVIEFPKIDLEVTHIILYRGQCARCGKTAKALIPSEKRTGYGPRLSALIAEMVGTHIDSRRTVQNFCASVLDLSISQGGIQKILERASAAIAPHYETIAETTRNADINHIDETSWRTRGGLRWLWVMGNATTACFMIHPNRSKKAFEALIRDWMGTLVCDGYGVYQNWPGPRQACLAHLIRQAKGLSERNDPELVRCGTWALQELRRLCHMAKAPPSVGEWNMFYARFVRLITLYKDRQNDAGKLIRQLLSQLDHLWVFLQQQGVAPTNNHAERLLRFAVLWRKSSFGTASQKGERWVERILSLRQTCRLQGRRTFVVLTDAMDAFNRGVLPDTAWIAATGK